MKIIIDGKAAEVSVSGGGLPEGTVAIKPLTKAEYDALTDEEKQADVAYAITDDAGSGGGSGGTSEEIYSTEETRIGTWIDGRPLYRRTYTLNIITNSAGAITLLDVSDLHIDTMMDLYGGFTGLTFNSGLFDQPINGTYAIGLSEDKTNLVAYTSSNNQNRINFIILEYTKTTDTGGAT